MAEEKTEAVEGAEAAGPKLILGMPLPQFLLVAANALVMLGGLGYVAQVSLFYKRPPITEPQVVAEIQKKTAKNEGAQGFFVESYPENTINLRTQRGGKNHYATVEVSLVCLTERCHEQLKAIRAKVEDAIHSAISARSYQELQSLDVKLRIKEDLLKRVNSYLGDTAATEVLFTSFVVQ